jgi:2-haloacid dehalogenase
MMNCLASGQRFPMQTKAILFDAYGTIFDIHSVTANAAADLPGDLVALSRLWRRTQVELTWRYALMERYEDFWKLTERALRQSIRELRITATESQLDQLTQSYLSPSVFPDARVALEQLRGQPLGILSNGSPAMLDSAVHRGGLEPVFTHIISVDSVKTYKPSPRVYALGPQILKLPPAEILFVSSNLWDAEGAKAFGYLVCWCNRSGAEVNNSPFVPDHSITSLDQLPALLA